MTRINPVKLIISYFALAFLLCASAHAQQQIDQQRGTRTAGGRDSRPEESSDLAQENLSRVAASVTQIRQVLVKDEGLLVELKRWLAK